MNPTNIRTAYQGSIVVQSVEFEDGKTVERIKEPTRLVGICHDPINDTVMIVFDDCTGSMMRQERFPTYPVKSHMPASESLAASIQEATGATVKSTQFISTFMATPEIAWAPVQMYYVTFDSRTVTDNRDIKLITAKELFQEVREGIHDDIGLIFGAHYLKMMHHNLIK
jgi:hypothetical protein